MHSVVLCTHTNKPCIRRNDDADDVLEKGRVAFFGISLENWRFLFCHSAQLSQLIFR